MLYSHSKDEEALYCKGKLHSTLLREQSVHYTLCKERGGKNTHLHECPQLLRCTRLASVLILLDGQGETVASTESNTYRRHSDLTAWKTAWTPALG